MPLTSIYPVCVQAAGFVELEIGSATYRVELALTSSELRQGLMRRQTLDRYGGMLLVFRRPGDHRIWMKNVLIPLRVYWIDADFRVVGTQRLEPCERVPCPVYSVDKASLYVLELSDHEHDLGTGDRLDGLTALPR